MPGEEIGTFTASGHGCTFSFSISVGHRPDGTSTVNFTGDVQGQDTVDTESQNPATSTPVQETCGCKATIAPNEPETWTTADSIDDFTPRVVV